MLDGAGACLLELSEYINPASVDRVVYPVLSRVFIYPRWCRISSPRQYVQDVDLISIPNLLKLNLERSLMAEMNINETYAKI